MNILKQIQAIVDKHKNPDTILLGRKQYQDLMDYGRSQFSYDVLCGKEICGIKIATVSSDDYLAVVEKKEEEE